MIGEDKPYGTLCFAPIVWFHNEIEETSDGSGVYVAHPPKPVHDGHWVGYYVNLMFEGDTEQSKFSVMQNQYHVTTMGWVYPNTLPFEDCHGVECSGKLL